MRCQIERHKSQRFFGGKQEDSIVSTPDQERRHSRGWHWWKTLLGLLCHGYNGWAGSPQKKRLGCNFRQQELGVSENKVV